MTYNELFKLFGLSNIDTETYNKIIYTIRKLIAKIKKNGNSRIKVLGYDNKEHEVNLSEHLITDILKAYPDYTDREDIDYTNILCQTTNRYAIGCDNIRTHKKVPKKLINTIKQVMEKGYSEFICSLILCDLDYGKVNMYSFQWFNTIEMLRLYLDMEKQLFKDKENIMKNSGFAELINFDYCDWAFYYVLLKYSGMSTEKMFKLISNIGIHFEYKDINLGDYLYKLKQGKDEEKSFMECRKENEDYHTGNIFVYMEGDTKDNDNTLIIKLLEEKGIID